MFKKVMETWKDWFIVNSFSVISSPHIKQFFCHRDADRIVDIVTSFWAWKTEESWFDYM